MELLKKIGRGLGKGLSWIGEKTHIGVLEDAGRAIQDACRETSRKTGASKEYNRDTATIDQTAYVAEILAGFSVGLKSDGARIEAMAKRDVEDFFDKLYKDLNPVFESKSTLRALILQKTMVLDSIDGCFNEIMSRRVSLSDPECLEILKLPKGPEKEKKMEAFGNKVINEGLDRLCESVKKATESIRNETNEELNDTVQAQQKALKNIARQIEDVIRKRQQDANDKESSILFPSQKLAASELILNLMQGGSLA